MGTTDDFWEHSRASVDLIANQVRVLKILKLDELLAGYERADSLGAILDPTGYRNHGDSIQTAKRIVVATKRWIEEVERALENDSRRSAGR